MPDDAIKLATYRRMDEGTKEDYDLIGKYFDAFERKLADRVLAALPGLKQSYPGETIDRYQHSLQTATKAHRDGRDEEFVVAALLHDIGDLLAPLNHSEYCASIIKPYVRPHIHWMILKHGIFQGKHYFHHVGFDRDMREKYRGHPAFELTCEFTDLYDQTAFDPDYDTMPLEAFEPMVRRLFARPAWGPHTKLDGGYGGERF